jgi:hypothetical protein
MSTTGSTALVIGGVAPRTRGRGARHHLHQLRSDRVLVLDGHYWGPVLGLLLSKSRLADLGLLATGISVPCHAVVPNSSFGEALVG